MRRFTLTAEHVALLRAAWVGWNSLEFGAPSIEPKRPYGNGDVLGDIAGLLSMQPEGAPDSYGEQDWTDEQEERLRRLHLETATALQVVLATGGFVPGRYVASGYGKEWRLEESRDTTPREAG